MTSVSFNQGNPILDYVKYMKEGKIDTSYTTYSPILSLGTYIPTAEEKEKLSKGSSPKKPTLGKWELHGK